VSPSLQVLPFAAKVSDGQDAALPVQFSATSHWPAAVRQTVDDGLNEFAGHVDDEPVHVAATSQTSAAARHCVPALPAACWHATAVPLHVSVVHGLPSSVQAVPFASLASAGQFAEFPGQFSDWSHTSAAARHTVLEAAKPLPGQVVEEPLQISATSQAPFAARQTVPIVTAVHSPTWPGTLHAPQPRLHALSQQTPFTQWLPAHWLSAVQSMPNEDS